MKMPLEFQYDNLVIGASLEALLFSFYNRFKTIYTRRLQPHHLDKIEDYGQGTDKLNIWNRHALQLGIAGYFPFENKIKHIRYKDSNTIKVITNDENSYTIKFNKLYIFDDHEILDLPPHKDSTSKEIRIVDYFETLNTRKHCLESIQNRTKFMNQIIFVPKNEKYNTNKVIVVSYLNKNKIDDVPDSLVKVKLESYLDSIGIKLASQYKKVNIEHTKRDIIELGVNIYDDFDNVEFAYSDPKIIYMMNLRRVKIDYMKYFRLKLKVTNDRDEW